MVAITFLGAAGTVTGSKYLVEGKHTRLLIDAGMFQGSREWREHNWETPGVDFSSVDATLLTHAHIDHTGLLPRFWSQGLRAPVYATAATTALCHLLLPDTGRLQEEEAAWRSKRGRSRHHPPLPLCTEEQAREVLKLFRNVPVNRSVKIADGVTATWSRMGHILGAAAVTLQIDGKTINFSGDIGRYNVPILHNPEPLGFGDLLLIESTYGDRLHDDQDPQDLLANVLNRTFSRGGVVVIPSFAVGRTQLMLFYLRELKAAKRIPDVPVIVDSPMATDATGLYRSYVDDYDEAALGIVKNGNNPFVFPKLHFTRDRSESIKLNSIAEPMVIISASGMLSGGRILHHLAHRVSSPLNTVLFVGFQPPGGRGAWMQSGAASMRILGHEVEIRAEVASISGLSAHADRDELLRWCKSCSGKPGRVAVVHGEDSSRNAFAGTLRKEFGWEVSLPGYASHLQL